MKLNKKKKIIIYAILIMTLAAGSFCTYKFFTKIPEEKLEEKEKQTLKGKFKDSMPKVDASLATQPLMNAFTEYFAGDEALQKVEENYTNTHPGYVKLVNKEADLIIVTEPSKEELELANEKGVELEVTKVVNEGFVFFVNKNNPVNNIELSDIVDIYSGKKDNWADVGGDNEKIIAYQRPINSGSQTGMLSLVMKDVPIKTPTRQEMVETMGGIIDIVANYDNNKYGLGYSYYYYANIMYGTPNIKFLSINGIAPNYEHIQDETYPLMTAYYIVTRKGDTTINKFKEALLSKEGAKIAREAGYVPTNR